MEKETAENGILNHKRRFVLVALGNSNRLEHFQINGKMIHIEKNK